MDIEESCIEIIKSRSKPLKPIPAGVSGRGKIRKSLEAILFDIYGTLFVSGGGDISTTELKIKPDTLEKLLKKYGIKLNAIKVLQEYIRKIKKNHDSMKKRGIEYPEVEIDFIWMQVLGIEDRGMARLFACDFEMTFNPVWPMPYLKELLEVLREKRIKAGIVSNAQFYTPLIFRAFFDNPPQELGFDRDLIFYSFQVGEAKPSTFLFQKAKEKLEEIGIKPLKTLYVGNDMLNDIYPSFITGFQTALFAGDRRSLRLRKGEKRCFYIEPGLIVTGLQELVEIINKMR